MTDQEKAIEMAKEAGWSCIYSEWKSPTEKTYLTVPATQEQINNFYLLAKNEAFREAAKLCRKRAEIVEAHTNESSDITQSAAHFNSGVVTSCLRNEKEILTLIKEPS